MKYTLENKYERKKITGTVCNFQTHTISQTIVTRNKFETEGYRKFSDILEEVFSLEGVTKVKNTQWGSKVPQLCIAVRNFYEFDWDHYPVILTLSDQTFGKEVDFSPRNKYRDRESLQMELKNFMEVIQEVRTIIPQQLGNYLLPEFIADRERVLLRATKYLKTLVYHKFPLKGEIGTGVKGNQ